MRFQTFEFKGRNVVLAALAALAMLTLAGLLTLALMPRSLPELVDQARAVVGPAPIAFAENTFYGLADIYHRLTFRGRTTPGYWESPTPQPAQPAVSAMTAPPQPSAPHVAAVKEQRPALPVPATPTLAPSPTPAPTASPTPVFVFHPRDVSPLYAQLAAPGEGLWIAMPNALDAKRAALPLMYKTFLHPDPARPFARVAIVAIDATRVRLHAVAGTWEPVSPALVERTGLIPTSDLPSLVAAFNGGFRAMHGHYGMTVNGQTLLPPQPGADTIAIYPEGRVDIAPWPVISDTLPQMESFRQTPPYLAYRGQVNPALVNERSIVWGAAVDSNTVIWRSALGLSADGRTLFYAAGESLTARRLAEALVAAGASNVAELDVNWSFERFLTYAPVNGHLAEDVLLNGMIYQPGMYVSRPAQRDFFYLTLALAASVRPASFRTGHPWDGQGQ
jgi:hypothetical protein